MSDFLNNRAGYVTAKMPYVKNKIYFDRNGDRVRYNHTTNFDWFSWVDKANKDGLFMVSLVYEKREQRAGSNCCFQDFIGETDICSKCKEHADIAFIE